MLSDNIKSANYVTLAASEHEKFVAMRLIAVVLLLLLAATIGASLFVIFSMRNPVVRIGDRGMLLDEPSVAERQYVAWEAARGILAVSPDAERQILESKMWMTDALAEETDRNLAAYERKFGSSYYKDCAAQGYSTAWDELEAQCESPVGSGASKRYPVLIRGTKTTLTRRNAPISSRPFAIRVWLARVTEDEENPTGLLAERFETPKDLDGDNDLPEIAKEPVKSEEAPQ